MGLRGPKPAPSDVKIAKGETRPSRINYDEPTFPRATQIDPPAGLRGAGLREWERIAPILQEAEVLRATDLNVLEDYCRALSDLRTFEAKAKRVSAERSIAKGFANAVLRLRAQVNQLRRELGLSPTSSAGLKISRTSSIKSKLLSFTSGKSSVVARKESEK